MAGELTEPLAGLIATLLLERFCDPLVQSVRRARPRSSYSACSTSAWVNVKRPARSESSLSSDAATA